MGMDVRLLLVQICVQGSSHHLANDDCYSALVYSVPYCFFHQHFSFLHVWRSYDFGPTNLNIGSLRRKKRSSGLWLYVFFLWCFCSPWKSRCEALLIQNWLRRDAFCVYDVNICSIRFNFLIWLQKEAQLFVTLLRKSCVPRKVRFYQDRTRLVQKSVNVWAVYTSQDK